MTTETQQLIDLAAGGEQTPVRVEIYWSDEDPANEGPAYRIGEPGSGHQESGEMEFVGWSTNDEDSMGYVLDAYFDGDGRYLGPDTYGVHPEFSVATERPVRRITRHHDVMGGEPVIRGLRITARQVASMATSGMSPEVIVGEYPFLEPEDVRAALIHCAAYALLPKPPGGIVEDIRRCMDAREILIEDRLPRLASEILVAILSGLAP